MSSHAATASIVEVSRERAPVARMAVVALVYLTIVLTAAVYPLASPLRDYWNAPVNPVAQLASAVTALLWLLVLLASMARQPRGRLWKLIFLAIATQQIGALAYVPNSLVWSAARVLEVVGLAVYIHLLVAFPSGVLRDRFDRLVVGWAYALVGAWMLVQLLLAGDWWRLACSADGDCIHNVLVFWPNGDWHELLRQAIAALGSLTVFPLVLVALWRHWQAAGSAARRTLLPLVVSVPLWLVLTTADILSDQLGLQPGIDFFASAAGLAVQLLIPLIIPTGLLVGIMRSRWGRGRIAVLMVELGRGVPVGGLRDVLARALDDPTLELAFAAPSGTGFVDANGHPVELPVGDPTRAVTRLERDDELLGVLIHDPAIDEDDPGLVEAVGNAARLSLENERLAAEVRAQLEEVRASRTRVVEAADAERRRVERDLHDGAQQRLVALALRLQLAKAANPDAETLLDAATVELETAIGEVRGLARGLHPTILTEAGLGAAVEALAERTPIVLTVDIPSTRFPPAAEATAYFVVAEALTNVTRYAEATEARVDVDASGGRLTVVISDDGRGGADPSAGSGLRGLDDRLAAAGGSLIVTSPIGGGTVVRAEIPLDPAPAADGGQDPDPVIAGADHRARARLRAVAASSPSEPSRRAGVLSHPGVLIVGLAALVALAAMLTARLTGQATAPVAGLDETFARPYAYTVPPNSGIRLYPGPLGSDEEEHSERVHVLARSRASGEGITVWAVDLVHGDACDAKSRLVARAAGVDGLVAHLRSIDRLEVTDSEWRIVDGRAAVTVDLTVEGEASGCPDGAIYPWRDPTTSQVLWVGDHERVHLELVDVDEATVVFEVWSQVDIAAWIPTARQVIDSVRFFYRPPGGGSPLTSPTPP